MSSSKSQQCGTLIKKSGMPEARLCFRPKGHSGSHSPDLTGLKNVFGYTEVLHLAPDAVYPSGHHFTQWVMLDKFGDERLVLAFRLFNGVASGKISVRGSDFSSRNDGKNAPEYMTVRAHYNWTLNPNNRQYNSYKNMKFFDGWNPDKGGSLRAGAAWIKSHLRSKPGPDWQIHVLKTKKHPHGFFGPGGIVWRHKMDRHDQNVLDLIHEWPKKKLREFVKNEIHPLLKAA